MNKILIYIVAAAIVAILGVDTFLAVTGKATPTVIVELAVGGAAILAFAAAAFVRTVGGFPFPWRSAKTDPVVERLDELDESVSSWNESMESAVDSIRELRDDIDDRLGPKPDAYVATVNTVDENGKLVRVYDLPQEDTREDAIEKARESIEARDAEGQTVENARITLTPVYN